MEGKVNSYVDSKLIQMDEVREKYCTSACTVEIFTVHVRLRQNTQEYSHIDFFSKRSQSVSACQRQLVIAAFTT